MRKAIHFAACASMLALPLLSSCGTSAKADTDALPEGFNSLSDASKVKYMMETVSPDSVARFICDAALGKTAGVSIDTFAIAAAYAYENFNDSCLTIFSEEIDGYSSNLPLPEKMKIYYMSGKADPQRMGYQLGLEYVNHIRESRMTVSQINDEISAFRDACAQDSATYRRFMKGFQTVLRLDHGKDLPEEIYSTFIDR